MQNILNVIFYLLNLITTPFFAGGGSFVYCYMTVKQGPDFQKILGKILSLA